MGLEATTIDWCPTCGTTNSGAVCRDCGDVLQARPHDSASLPIVQGDVTGTVIARARRSPAAPRNNSPTAGSGERLRAQVPTAAPRRLKPHNLLIPLFMTRGNVVRSLATIVASGVLLVWLPLYTTFWNTDIKLLISAAGIAVIWTATAIVQYRSEMKLLADLPFAMPGYLETLVDPHTDRYERYVQATVIFAASWPPMAAAENIAQSLTVASPQQIDGEDITLRVHTVTIEGRWRFELATTGRQRDLMLRFVLDRLLAVHESHPIQAIHWRHGTGL